MPCPFDNIQRVITAVFSTNLSNSSIITQSYLYSCLVCLGYAITMRCHIDLYCLSRCIPHDVLAPCDIWHDVSKSPRLSYNIINACVLGDRLPKGIACLTIEKPLRQPRPTVSSRRWRLCWTVFTPIIHLCK